MPAADLRPALPALQVGDLFPGWSVGERLSRGGIAEAVAKNHRAELVRAARGSGQLWAVPWCGDALGWGGLSPRSCSVVSEAERHGMV